MRILCNISAAHLQAKHARRLAAAEKARQDVAMQKPNFIRSRKRVHRYVWVGSTLWLYIEHRGGQTLIRKLWERPKNEQETGPVRDRHERAGKPSDCIRSTRISKLVAKVRNVGWKVHRHCSDLFRTDNDKDLRVP